MPLAEKYGKVFVGMGGHMKSLNRDILIVLEALL